jgi:outer membrane lipoprotein-sorting protein
MKNILAVLLALICLSGSAQADQAGMAWLKRLDAAAALSDAHLRLSLQVTDAKGQTSSREIEIWQKGTEHRLVRMISPARLKGVGLLVGPSSSLHLFLPSYPPARRVVGSKRSDAFMGTDFAIEDLSRITYSDHYDATVQSNEGGKVHLVLSPLEDADGSTVRLVVGSQGPPDVERIEHVDAGGTVTRRLTMQDYRAVDGFRIAHQTRVEDLRRGRTTQARLTKVEIGSGLQERIFTVTHLEHP